MYSYCRPNPNGLQLPTLSTDWSIIPPLTFGYPKMS